MAFTPKSKEFESKAGKKYTFQTVPNSTQAHIWDEGTNDAGAVINTKMMPLMLENIVVDPQNLTMDDFDTWAELTEVTTAALTFLQTGE